MDHQQSVDLFAVVSPGLEPVCAREMTGLGLTGLDVTAGGIACRVRLADIYRCNLRLRTASRLVVRFGRFRCRDFPALYQAAVRLPWGRFLRPGTVLECRVTCRNSRLTHGGRVAETLAAAAAHALGGESAPPTPFRQLLLVRIVDDQVELSIDSSGELLHRRGCRTRVTAAPLRETLAAGVLALLGWHGDEPLVDPMCGSGTFLLEGALLATGRAPGLQRDFAFLHWPGFRQGLWAKLCDEARQEQHPCAVRIAGADGDPAALTAAHANLVRAGLDDVVSLEPLVLAEQPVHSGGGLVVCNPPYGRRLLAKQPLEGCFAALGRELRRAFPLWRKALLSPDPRLAAATGLALREVAVLDNGGLRVGLYATG